MGSSTGLQKTCGELRGSESCGTPTRIASQQHTGTDGAVTAVEIGVRGENEQRRTHGTWSRHHVSTRKKVYEDPEGELVDSGSVRIAVVYTVP